MASATLTGAMDMSPGFDRQQAAQNFPQQGSQAASAPMDLPVAPGPWTDNEALNIALRDHQLAENYRTQNHDWRFQTADEVYLAYVRRKTWEGTRIPRASLQIHIAFQQVESLLPAIIAAIFQGDLALEALPRNSRTTVEQAMQVMQLLKYQMRNIDGENPKFNTLREVFRRMVKQNLIYGNGIAEFGWQERMDARTYWQRKTGPEMTNLPNVTNTGTIQVPTGRDTQWLEQIKENTLVSQPYLKFCDIRDFYIDPNCPSPNIQEAQYCSRPSLVPISYIQSIRGQEQFKIPSDAELIRLSKKKFYTVGLNTKSVTESLRGGSFMPATDQSVDPQNARVELIRYWQKGKAVWVLGREHPIFNQDNTLGVLPFFGLCYADVPGRFYGQGIPDLVESDQKFGEALLNGRVDELNLILHAPIVKKRGIIFPPSMQRIRPGVLWEAENPTTDIVRMQMGNVTQQAFVEMQALEQRCQAKTGVTDLAVLGVPSSGGNSANRTATGVSTQTNASNSRTHYQVMMAEDLFFTPLLQAMMGMNRKFLDPNVMMEILGTDGQILQLDPIDVLNADVDFDVNMGTRMKARAALQGGGMMAFMQYAMNPEITSQMAEQQQKTLDVEGVTELFCDTYGLPPTALWRKMSPQEIQAMQQKQNGPLQLKEAMQNARLQAQSSMADGRDETKLLMALIQMLVKTPGLQKELGIDVGGLLDRDPAKMAGAAANPSPSTHVFNAAAWQAANKGKDVSKAKAEAKKQGYTIH